MFLNFMQIYHVSLFLIDRVVNKEVYIFFYIFLDFESVIHAGMHVVGGVGSVTKIHVNNVRNQGNY